MKRKLSACPRTVQVAIFSVRAGTIHAKGVKEL